MTCTPEELERFSAIARDEMEETEESLSKAKKKVKKLIAEKYPDLLLPIDWDFTDGLMERSIRYKKLDVAQAANQVHLYFKLLSDLHNLHKNMYFLPSMHQEYFYETFGLSVLKHRDSKGRIIVTCDYEKLPSNTYNFDKGLAAMVLLLDEITRRSVDTQRLGMVFICNFKGYSFAHAKGFASFLRIRALARMFRGSFPIRYKEMHLVRCPALFSSTYSFAKPFVGEKFMSRVYLHGNNLEEFHEHVSPDILPEIFGGKLSNNQAFDLDFMQQFANSDGYYKELFQFGYANTGDVHNRNY